MEWIGLLDRGRVSKALPTRQPDLPKTLTLRLITGACWDRCLFKSKTLYGAGALLNFSLVIGRVPWRSVRNVFSQEED